MEEPAPDQKPSKALALYVPLALGMLTLASVPFGGCDLSWPWMVLGLASGGFAFVFGIWWIAVMVCFHGYHFVRGLFHHPN